jgi:hypothetical protein
MTWELLDVATVLGTSAMLAYSGSPQPPLQWRSREEHFDRVDAQPFPRIVSAVQCSLQSVRSDHDETRAYPRADRLQCGIRRR